MQIGRTILLTILVFSLLNLPFNVYSYSGF